MATRTQRLHRKRNREALLRTSREFGEQVGLAAMLAAVPWAKDEEDEEEDKDEEEEIEAVKVPPEGEQVKPEGDAPAETPPAETPVETTPATDEPAAKTDEPPVETPPEVPADKPDEEKPKEPPIETTPKPDPEAIDPELVDDEDELDEDEIDAECAKKKAMAAQLTLVAMGMPPVLAFNPHHGADGRFSDAEGSTLSDPAANAARDTAKAASKSAYERSGTHRAAREAYTGAAQIAEHVSKRSQVAFTNALAVGDELGADEHLKEYTKAFSNAAKFRKKEMEHRLQEEEESARKDQAIKEGISRGKWAVATLGLSELFRRKEKVPTHVSAPTQKQTESNEGAGWETEPSEIGTPSSRAAKRSIASSIFRDTASVTKTGASAFGSAVAKGAKEGAAYAMEKAIQKSFDARKPSPTPRTIPTPPPIPRREAAKPPPLPTRTTATPPPLPRSSWKESYTVSSPTGHSQSFDTGTHSVPTPSVSRSSLYLPPSYGGGRERSIPKPADVLKKRLYSAQVITDSIMARFHVGYPVIQAASTNYGDIIAVAPSRVSLSHQTDIKATGEVIRTPRFTIAPAYNGGPLKVERYPLPIIVDLAGMTINPQSVQAVLFHDGDRLVGHVDDVKNNGRSVTLAGPLSGLQSSVDEFAGSMKRGFPWKASIEARPLSKPEHIPAGKRVFVNGQTFDGPVLVARKTELYGVSFVPRGADDKTQVSIAARAARNPTIKEKNQMETITFAEWLSQGLGLIEAELSPTQQTALKAKYDEAVAAIKAAQHTDPDPPPPPPEAPKPPTDGFELDIIRAKFDMKMDELDNLYAKYEIDENLDKMKFIGIKAEAKKSMQDLRATAIDKRMNGDLFDERCNVIRAGAQLKLVQESRPKGPAIHNVSRGDPELTGDILAAAVMQTGRYQLREHGYDVAGNETGKVIQRPEDIYKPEILEAAEKKFRRGIGLQELIIEAAQANGWQGRNFKQNPTECMQYAFPMQCRNQFGAPIQASAFSTVDVAGILSNIANKFLLQGFFFVEQAWRSISDIRSVSDFKTVTSYRLTGADEFKEVAPGGEIQHGTLGEESYTNKANTYGLMLSVTRTDIINDDLGAITTVPRKLGNGAGKALNKVFWTKFLGQISTLFTAARLNYFSGAATNLQISSLTTAEQMFMDLKDANSDPIGHTPAILLTPTGLSATAAQLFKDTEIRKTGSTDNTYTVGNPHQGKFRPVVSRYINTSTYTGYTTTGWGIFADPQEVAVMEMCFLNGIESPTVEQAIADFNQLGIQMRGILDFGCNTQDYRGAVWSKGAV